jgi:hypothetical protein
MKKTNNLLEILFWTLLTAICTTGMLMLIEQMYGLYIYFILLFIAFITITVLIVEYFKNKLNKRRY